MKNHKGVYPLLEFIATIKKVRSQFKAAIEHFLYLKCKVKTTLADSFKLTHEAVSDC